MAMPTNLTTGSFGFIKFWMVWDREEVQEFFWLFLIAVIRT